MINPHKRKYHKMYWEMAYDAARQSVATRRRVGAVIVMPTGMISVGWNGMPSGLPNECEIDGETDPRVIHAERNAIDKMTRQGVPTQGSVLFTTTSPCFECAKSLSGLGLKEIHFDEVFRCSKGLELLVSMGIPVYQRDSPIPWKYHFNRTAKP